MTTKKKNTTSTKSKKATPATTPTPSTNTTPSTDVTPSDITSLMNDVGGYGSSSTGASTPTASTKADLQMQAAIANSLAPYLKSMSAYSQSATDNGQTTYTPDRSIKDAENNDLHPIPHKNPVSAENKQMDQYLSMIKDPTARADAQSGTQGLESAIGALPGALKQYNASAGPSDVINMLLNAISSRIDYYGNANALPYVRNNPVTNTLSNVLSYAINNTDTNQIIPEVNNTSPAATAAATPTSTAKSSTSTAPLSAQATTPQTDYLSPSSDLSTFIKLLSSPNQSSNTQTRPITSGIPTVNK
jgi:hypothetical protein